jgi:hypothetical protein
MHVLFEPNIPDVGWLQTLPFLAELLEDPEPAVEARAQDLQKLLEEVSGEKLDDYLRTA